VSRDAGTAGAFAPGTEGKYFADLYALARARLSAAGVAAVFGGGYCTASEDRFFSFRRDGTTGRMASLIWLEDV
jgi:copper oxidase (laccase) domain-containing protein